MTRRALVLGGGGPVGIAWEVGLLAGLLEAGCDLRDADYVLGTSAGSFVGSQLAAGRDMRQTYEAILLEEQRARSAADGAHRTPPGGARATGGPPADDQAHAADDRSR
jgi:NTE family protein